MLSQLKRKLEIHKKTITDEMLYKVFRRQKKVHLWFNVEFREMLRMFLSEHPYMIDEIELVEGKTSYWRVIQENYGNPSPAQAKVRDLQPFSIFNRSSQVHSSSGYPENLTCFSS